MGNVFMKLKLCREEGLKRGGRSSDLDFNSSTKKISNLNRALNHRTGQKQIIYTVTARSRHPLLTNSQARISQQHCRYHNLLAALFFNGCKWQYQYTQNDSRCFHKQELKVSKGMAENHLTYHGGLKFFVAKDNTTH